MKHSQAPSYLLSAAKIDGLPQSGLFIYYSSSAITNLITLEAYKLQDGVNFRVQTDASPSRIEGAKRRITDLMNKITPRSDHEIPTVSGFCFKDGFVPDAGQKEEYFEASITFLDHPDVLLDIDTTRNGIDNFEEPLLQKFAEGKAENGGSFKGVTILREANRQIGDMPGQEVIFKGEQEGGFMGHYFRWEAIGLPDDSMHPKIAIELSKANLFRTISGQPATLTDEEAMLLWERILKSFRLRPVTIPEKTGEVLHKKIKLGAIIETNRESCPQTGFWVSTLTNERVFMREGERVPSATIKRKLSLMEKLNGESEYYYEASTWTLADYADLKKNIIQG